MMPKLVLFDIDGTLLLTGGAGIRAMNRACAELMGATDPLAGIAVAGRTDRSILADAFARLGRELDDDLLARLRDRYVACLAEEIHQPGRGVKAVMPGIRELLDELHARDAVFLALLTGNFEAGARIKLEYFDLWKYFRCGAYGDDAADRNALVPVAVGRARDCGLPDLPARDVIVVGDTPHDVACARAVSAQSVGVATGSFSVESLQEAGADVVFQDLTDTRAFLRIVE
jgi:phosphoglycolate phosphatase-like HAD superfamily hydrolase